MHNLSTESEPETQSIPLSQSSHSHSIDNETEDVDLTDSANFRVVMTTNFRERIIRIGPVQIEMEFPKTAYRSFSKFYYSKKMPNGEEIQREWLIYSKKLDAVHCFPCRIFGIHSIDSKMASASGYNDWQHLSRAIKTHESSETHLNNSATWKNAFQRISNENSINHQLMNECRAEIERMREVFKRLIVFALYLARQNIAFTGSSSNIDDSEGRNGNFQQLVHACSKFDPILKQHLEMHQKVHYLSPKIQNELIHIIGSKVQQQILSSVRKFKYYAIILDGTTDVSRIEQMCVILRYVYFDEADRKWQIRESFIKFVDISSTKTGALITDVALRELESMGLNIDDIRGQGFDNGSPMKGKNIGVQKRILDKNPRAFFCPCSNHSLNLSVNDSADITPTTTEFFSIVQQIYVFLSGSTNRWDILKKKSINNESIDSKRIVSNAMV